MATTFPEVRITNLTCTLYEYIQQGQQTNPQTQISEPVYGKQMPSLASKLALYLAGTDLLLGHQSYNFGDTPIPANDDHKGLPPFTEIITPEVVAAVVAAIEGAIDAAIPSFNLAEDQKTTGPRQWFRVNRIVINLPYKDPANQFIQANIGVYRDKDFKRQDIEAGFAVGFVHDEFLVQRFGQGVDIPATRKLQNMFPLTDFLVDPTVGDAFKATATNYFTVLKNCVNNWSDVSVETILSKFAATLVGIATRQK